MCNLSLSPEILRGPERQSGKWLANVTGEIRVLSWGSWSHRLKNLRMDSKGTLGTVNLSGCLEEEDGEEKGERTCCLCPADPMSSQAASWRVGSAV